MRPLPALKSNPRIARCCVTKWTDLKKRWARCGQSPTETALLYVLHFEREPSVHHWTAPVAHFDDQIARKSVTVANRQLVPQHVGRA